MADDDPNEPGFNAMRKYVVSTTLTSADAWRNSTLISDNVVEQVRALKAQPGTNILMDGSSELVHKEQCFSSMSEAVERALSASRGATPAEERERYMRFLKCDAIDWKWVCLWATQIGD